MTDTFNILGVMDRSKKVLVVGPIVVNETITGNCKRIASDFPIPVFEDAKRSFGIGGPGNLVKNMTALALDVDFITMVGDTDQYAVDTMKTEGIDTSGVIICTGYSVAKKIRYSAGGHMSFRMNEGNEVFVVSSSVENKIVSTFSEKVDKTNYSVIVLSDYRFGMLSDVVTSTIISISKRKGIPVIADPPKFGNYDKFRGCTLLKPNLDEAKGYLGHRITSVVDIKDACIGICERMESLFTIITLADRGIAFFDKYHDIYAVFPALDGIDIVDVNGAGDTVLAVIAFGIANQVDFGNICKFANQCASNVIQKSGTTTVNLLEVIGSGGPESLILTSKRELINLKQLLVGQGDIVLVISSFRPIKTHHLRVLKKAKTLGQHLIVAVDASTNGTPFDKDFVLEFLASNRNVNYVVMLGDFKREEVIRTVQPSYVSEIEKDGGTFDRSVKL